ncbi:MAG TPA: RHS repeat-associated core domain-containing protein, partial [Nitrososphaera sp.]|nr:RHS repeat-associated core domain-containing protein [Nitrososphaera sp.]
RHDYLPFGEELLAGTGGRTISKGYSGDTVRQKFTSKERDIETGLDYFLARYYSSTQGRFTSPDEFTGGPDELYYFVDDTSANPTFYSDLKKPQSLNKYQYAYNNPLRYVDPDGHDPLEPQDPPCQCWTQAKVEALKRDIDSVMDKVATVTGISALADAMRSSAKSSRQTTDTIVTMTTLTVTAAVTAVLPMNVDPNAIPAGSTPPLAQPMPPPITMGKGKNKAKPTAPPLTGPAKAEADRKRKIEQRKRTKEQKKIDRTKPNPTGPNDPHDDEGPHHRDPSQGGRRGPRRN